jgi:hypothetical protein
MEEFDLVSCQPIKGSELMELEEVTIEVMLMTWSKERININTEELELQLKNRRMLANENHMFPFSLKNLSLGLTSNIPPPAKYGYIGDNTYV